MRKINIKSGAIEKIIDDFSKGQKKDFMGLGYLTGSSRDGYITIEGAYIPEQKREPGSAEVKPEQMLETMQKATRERKTLIGLVQYNANLSANETGTTMQSADDLSEKLRKPYLSVVLNARKDININLK